jgi:hypothetical protein
MNPSLHAHINELHIVGADRQSGINTLFIGERGESAKDWRMSSGL